MTCNRVGIGNNHIAAAFRVAHLNEGFFILAEKLIIGVEYAGVRRKVKNGGCIGQCVCNDNFCGGSVYCRNTVVIITLKKFFKHGCGKTQIRNIFFVAHKTKRELPDCSNRATSDRTQRNTLIRKLSDFHIKGFLRRA